MDSNNNNWRPAQPDPPANNMDASVDFRSQLQLDCRHRIVNKTMETLKRHLPFSGDEGLLELKKIAVRFEEKIYSAATSQSDYLRKTSLKMLTMETKSQNTIAGSLTANSSTTSAGAARNTMYPVTQNMQTQGPNQGGPMPLAAANQSQARQQMLAQNLSGTGNMTSASIQTSAGLASTLPVVSGIAQSPISNVINQSSLQNMVDTSSEEKTRDAPI